MEIAEPRLEPLPSRELAAFVAAVETGRLGAAADALSLTQSAVTKRIQSLERRLGTSLLARSHHGVRPTVEGTALYPEAKEGLAALARAARNVAGGHLEGQTHLRLAASHTIGEFLLPGWLAGFRLRAPHVRAQVELVNSSRVLRAVRDGDVEIGFLPRAAALTGFDSIPVGRDELVVVVSPSHRWTRGKSVDPAQLASEPFFSREEGSDTRATAIAAARGLGVDLQPRLEAASTQALKRSVLRSGFTIISCLAVEEERLTARLGVLQIRGADLSRSLYAIKRRGAQSEVAPQRFWAWLGDHRA